VSNVDEFHRYLRLLGLNHGPAGVEGLRALVERHLAVIPFENLSKLLLYDREGAGRPLTLSEYLDGIEHSDLGGTCYSKNGFFAELLRYLGYEADLLGADMSKPNVHACIRARIEGIAYHVDIGFAAPFREPVRLDRLPAEVREGLNRYVIENDSAGVRVTQYREDTFVLRYVAHDPPRARDFFDPIAVGSFNLASEFMQRLRISRVLPSYSVDLTGHRLFRHEHGRTTFTDLHSLPELLGAVHNQLAMPRAPVEQAVTIVERLTARPYFPPGK